MTNQNNIIVGDRVLVLSGRHTGELATVSNIIWISNQFGSYARIHLSYEGGESDDRGRDSLEKVTDSTLTAYTSH